MDTSPQGCGGETSRKLRSWGFFNFRPNAIPWFNSTKWLLCTLSMYFFVVSTVVNGIFSPSIPTIERRFSLSSSNLGIITSMFDISALLVILPISYFGIRNRPRALGTGMFLSGIGFLVCLLPHLLIGKYSPVTDSTSLNNSASSFPLCTTDAAHTIRKCDGDAQASSNLYYILFLVGMGIGGLGVSPLVCIGIPMIDDSVKARVSPVYIALYNSSGVLGVGVGSALAFLFLRIFVHPGEEAGLQPGDSKWVGGWWIGFALGVVMSFIVSVALASLPKYFNVPVYSETNENQSQLKKHKEFLPAKDFGVHLKHLLIKYKSFVFISIWISLDFFVITGGIAFLPKIASVQFRIPVSSAALYVGFPVVIAGIAGNVTGAVILKRWNVSGRSALRMCLVFSVVAMLLGSFLFLSCDSTLFRGIDLPYPNRIEPITLINSCNSNCSCKEMDFQPVCGNFDTFISPCHAGCTSKGSSRLFLNCSCVVGHMKSAVLEACKKDCGYRPALYFTLTTLFVFSLTMTGSPGAIATLRSVPVHLKTFAVGIQWMLLRIIGSIPGPIFIGYLIDTTCTKWETLCDGKRGGCQLYDNKTMSIRVGLCFLAVQGASTLSVALALWFFKEIPNQAEEMGDTVSQETKA